jgi:anaerobic magnesium-protoporphyrin IX monomethyl ester cyclase
MIVLFNPRATKPKNRRYPLSILSVAAMIEGKEQYTILDGNLASLGDGSGWSLPGGEKPELLAVTVMPGPQLAAAVPFCENFRRRYPSVPIVWGGYFPSLYTDAVLGASYVDYAVRGQGEETFVELLACLRGKGHLSGVAGLSYKDRFGLQVHNPNRPLKSPDAFPRLPYHRLDASQYLLPTFLGSRTAVHQASIGCPFKCNFCGVVPVYDREKMEPAERTVSVLTHLKETYGANAVQFYDNNFFLREDHARELADRLEPLGMRWWCEARVDIVLGYSDDTLERLRRAGCTMIFFGVESGSNQTLAAMKKQLRTEQVQELAKRIREFGIVPEYSFIFGAPNNPESDTRDTIEFIRGIKRVNPDVEIVVQTYVPTPQRNGMFGGVDKQMEFPTTPDAWLGYPWYDKAIRKNPELAWLPRRVRRRIDEFETVMRSRWPTIQDIRLPVWGRLLLKTLSAWRYRLGVYSHPFELRLALKLVRLRQPRHESL